MLGFFVSQMEVNCVVCVLFFFQIIDLPEKEICTSKETYQIPANQGSLEAILYPFAARCILAQLDRKHINLHGSSATTSGWLISTQHSVSCLWG